MPTVGTDRLVAMPWGFPPGQLIAFCVPMVFGAGLGMRRIEVWCGDQVAELWSQVKLSQQKFLVQFWVFVFFF